MREGAQTSLRLQPCAYLPAVEDVCRRSDQTALAPKQSAFTRQSIIPDRIIVRQAQLMSREIRQWAIVAGNEQLGSAEKGRTEV